MFRNLDMKAKDAKEVILLNRFTTKAKEVCFNIYLIFLTIIIKGWLIKSSFSTFVAKETISKHR